MDALCKEISRCRARKVVSELLTMRGVQWGHVFDELSEADGHPATGRPMARDPKFEA
jgi:hypothetical protein